MGKIQALVFMVAVSGAIFSITNGMGGLAIICLIASIILYGDGGSSNYEDDGTY